MCACACVRDSVCVWVGLGGRQELKRGQARCQINKGFYSGKEVIGKRKGERNKNMETGKEMESSMLVPKASLFGSADCSSRDRTASLFPSVHACG